MTDGADSGTIMALDVGAVRIGVALANGVARIAHPFGAVANDASTIEHLKEVCTREHVTKVVIGLPRNLEGHDSTQTASARQMGLLIAQQLSIPFSWQDEAVTSVQAEAELKARGRPYDKADIDALAAVYILEDYLGVRV